MSRLKKTQTQRRKISLQIHNNITVWISPLVPLQRQVLVSVAVVVWCCRVFPPIFHATFAPSSAHKYSVYVCVCVCVFSLHDIDSVLHLCALEDVCVSVSVCVSACVLLCRVYVIHFLTTYGLGDGGTMLPTPFEWENACLALTVPLGCDSLVDHFMLLLQLDPVSISYTEGNSDREELFLDHLSRMSR